MLARAGGRGVSTVLQLACKTYAKCSAAECILERSGHIIIIMYTQASACTRNWLRVHSTRLQIYADFPSICNTFLQIRVGFSQPGTDFNYFVMDAVHLTYIFISLGWIISFFWRFSFDLRWINTEFNINVDRIVHNCVNSSPKGRYSRTICQQNTIKYC